MMNLDKKDNLKVLAVFVIICLSVLIIYFLTTTIALAENDKENINDDISLSTIEVKNMIDKFIKLSDEKLLLQQNISVINNQDALEEKKYFEKEKEKIDLTVPRIEEYLVTSVKVFLNDMLLPDDVYEYNGDVGSLEINLEASEEIKFSSKDEYKIIYEYELIEEKNNIENNENDEDNQNNEENQNDENNSTVNILETSEEENDISDIYNIDIDITIFTKIKGLIEQVSEVKEVLESTYIGNQISETVVSTKEIFKGYMYENKGNDTFYQEQYDIEISSLDNLENVEIVVDEAEFVNYKNVDGKSVRSVRSVINIGENIYVQAVRFNKEEVLDILGQDGRIDVQDINGNSIFEITKDSEVDEFGYVIFEFEDLSVNTFKIITSKPVKIGNLVFDKQMRVESENILDNISINELKAVQKLESSISLNSNVYSNSINVSEPTVNSEFSMDRETLDTMSVNEDVELRVVLSSEGSEEQLYKNPIIQIVMPDEIELIDISEDVNILNANGLSVKNVVVDGRSINIELQGEQLEYDEEAVDEAEVILKADITLNKRAVSNDKEIIVKIVNDGSDLKEIKSNINIKSPRDFILVGSVKEFNVETFDMLDKDIVLDNSIKSLEFKSEIICNVEQLQNMKIMGVLPTDNTKNNLGIVLNGDIEVNNSNVKIYYTENEKATDDVENEENGWSESINNNSLVKKYLILLDNVIKGENLILTYNVGIPEKISNDMKANLNYQVNYFKEGSNQLSVMESGDIKLSVVIEESQLQSNANIETKVTANVGNYVLNDGDKVKIGEVIRYNVKIKNIGSELLNNVKINYEIPEAVVLVKPIEGTEETDGYEYEYGEYYEEFIQSSYENIIDTLSVNEISEFEFEVRVKNDAVIDSEINNIINVEYDSKIIEVFNSSNIIEESSIRLTIKRVSDRSIEVKPEAMIRYQIIVENISDVELENIELDVTIPEIYTRTQVYEEGQTRDIDNLVISSLEPNGKVVYALICDIGNTGEAYSVLNLYLETIVDGKKVKSNLIDEIVEGLDIDFTAMSKNEGEKLDIGDIIEYNYSISYKGVRSNNLEFVSDVPNELHIKEIYINGEIIDYDRFNLVRFLRSMDHNDVWNIKIIAEVRFVEEREEDTEIINKSNVSIDGTSYGESEIKHTVIQKVNEYFGDLGEVEDPENPGGQEEPDKPGDSSDLDDDVSLSDIGGIAWLDMNSNGRIDSNEKNIGGMSVRLIDIVTNKYLNDVNGNEIVVKTDRDGKYTFNNIPNGKYIVVFEYDNLKYGLTDYMVDGDKASNTSNVLSKQVEINGNKKYCGVTNELIVLNKDILNINIGLVEISVFDIKIDKYIKKVTVQNSV